MYSVKISSIPPREQPMHVRAFAREIWGLSTGSKQFAVTHNVIFADGGAEMHTHEVNDHVYIVVKGALRCKTDKEDLVFHTGEAFVVEAGTPHEVSNSGEEDGEYYLVTSPPVNWDSVR